MDHAPPQLWAVAHELVSRSATNSTSTSATEASRPPVYKAIGISLAVASGLFIGISFVLKKTGLLKANAKYNEEAGEGYGYLKNWYWWSGMTLMIVGEICNFVAYAFVDAILVTPLGALSVVVTTILSAIFLKERLSFVGKVGCFNCIVGSVVIVLNAPEQSSVADIQEMQHFVIAPGFLSYAGVVIIACTFVALWVAPRYAKKSMLVYLSICSLIGGLSVVATQGLGSAVVAQASGKPQFNQWFLYVLLVFVVATLLTEIIYLNKALNIFNAALVTPTYYVFFTSATIVTSAILFRGFKGTAVTITTVILGFLQICTGVVLLQMSKSAKDVPDAAVFKGDLNQVREIAEVEQPETEPKADALRGAASLIRRMSVSRQKMEQEEARRLREDRMKDELEPLGENEIVEWDGLRRRKTVVGTPGSPTPRRTVHPPLGMSHFPDPNDEDRDPGPGFFENLRHRAQTVIRHSSPRDADPRAENAPRSPIYPVALTDIKLHPSHMESPIMPYGPGSLEDAQERIYGLPPGKRKEEDRQAGISAARPSPRSKPLPAKPSPSPTLKLPHETRRQFSFTNFLRPSSRTPDVDHDGARPALQSRGSGTSYEQKRARKNATEEERLGLVKDDECADSVEQTDSELEQSTTSDSQNQHSTQTKSAEGVPSSSRHEEPSTRVQSRKATATSTRRAGTGQSSGGSSVRPFPDFIDESELGHDSESRPWITPGPWRSSPSSSFRHDRTD
ncbi:Magnesium transporter NIPA2 [Exophiala dermatitidis]